MAKNTWEIALKAIQDHANIFIFHHIRPDGDCLGSQFGLRELIKSNFPEKNVFVLGENKELFPFMIWDFDKFEDIDKKYLNNSLGIVVDANDSIRIQFSNLILEKHFTHMLRIDHHPNDPDIAYDYTWEDATYAASAEQIAYIAMMANLKISLPTARYLYLGINTDSNRFMYDYVQKRTFDVVSYLHNAEGFKVWDINFPLSIREEKKVKFNAYVLYNYKKEDNVIYFHVTKKMLEKFNLSPTEASDVGILSNIGDCKVWVLFIDQPDGSIRARVRSNKIWINHVCQRFAPGGGHELAAGATCKNSRDIRNLINELKAEVKKYD
ncbi:phosphoesterase [[Mycoplasma] phocae]|uniref:Phosphoesterase n=1 Tax=[Mycoplasma] phocae TaxID=142651 RepID=A0A2Z5IR34_9BACT|nr:bifunctional oligoribonuclease/PAP phosphatase NrnA [[Mycoplasma] phocae]AXE60841.1 phosphoesterase [[Mycoplasma] phocae]